MVLTLVSDVAASDIALRSLDCRFQITQRTADDFKGSLRIIELRFEKGVSGYLEVLVAENELFAAEIASVGLQASHCTQRVHFCQAMCGGWVDIAEACAPQPQGLAAARRSP